MKKILFFFFFFFFFFFLTKRVCVLTLVEDCMSAISLTICEWGFHGTSVRFFFSRKVKTICEVNMETGWLARFFLFREKWKLLFWVFFFFSSFLGRIRFNSWRVQKATFGFHLMDVSGSIPERWFWLIRWKVGRLKPSVCGFLYSRKAKTSGCRVQLFFYSIIHFSRTLQVRFLNDGLVDQMIVVGKNSLFSIFFIRENRNPAVLLGSTVIYSITPYFLRTLQVRFLGASRRATNEYVSNGCLRFDSWKMGMVDIDDIWKKKFDTWFSIFFIREKRKPAVLFQLFFNSIIHFFQGRFRFDSWRVQKCDICVSFDGRLRFDSWKMGLVDKMIGSMSLLVFDFLHSRKAKTSCSFEVNYFSIQSYIFFKDAPGSIPGVSRRAFFGLFDTRLRFDSWMMGLVDQMIVVVEKQLGLRFSSFEKSENQLFSWINCFSFQSFFQGRFRFDSWRVQKSNIWFWNLFGKDVSGSIPERWVWLIRW